MQGLGRWPRCCGRARSCAQRPHAVAPASNPVYADTRHAGPHAARTPGTTGRVPSATGTSTHESSSPRPRRSGRRARSVTSCLCRNTWATSQGSPSLCLHLRHGHDHVVVHIDHGRRFGQKQLVEKHRVFMRDEARLREHVASRLLVRNTPPATKRLQSPRSRATISATPRARRAITAPFAIVCRHSCGISPYP